MEIKLNGCDAALVFRDDGTFEGWLAEYPPSGSVSANVLLMTALLDRLKNDPNLAREMRAWECRPRNNRIGTNVPNWTDLTDDQKTIITDAVLMPEFNDRAQIALDVYAAVSKALGRTANDVAVRR